MYRNCDRLVVGIKLRTFAIGSLKLLKIRWLFVICFYGFIIQYILYIPNLPILLATVTCMIQYRLSSSATINYITFSQVYNFEYMGGGLVTCHVDQHSMPCFIHRVFYIFFSCRITLIFVQDR